MRDFVSKNQSIHTAFSWTAVILRHDVFSLRHQCNEYSVAKQHFLSYTLKFLKQYYFVVFSWKIIGYGNPQNDPESSRTTPYLGMWHVKSKMHYGDFSFRCKAGGENHKMDPTISKLFTGTALCSQEVCKLTRKYKLEHGQCTYFLLYHWPWLGYLGNETNCCWVDIWIPKDNGSWS